ncbi:amino acid-binding protein [Shewanella maritima]|uniref:Glycine cleavage system transcriptional repressor n=1 Tax=Shewanella maritima TaxID=2520507 RepID=A0A411PDX5_9GAMM|nr:ACT domain-containing protein [Shewanella maritima]QBF81662.1 amino acid-binding protein [Shewanella maritima]
MMRYLITLQAPDRKGLVEQIANLISRHNGNWLDSEMRHIEGFFAAILQIEVPAEHIDDLIEGLECIEGLSFTHAKAQKVSEPDHTLRYQLVANDRPGIVLQISNQLNSIGINIEKFSSQFESASHTGIPLFKASFGISSAKALDEEQIEQALYTLGDDVLLDKLS